jgi:DNA-binding NarL/FixJ family response regulator
VDGHDLLPGPNPLADIIRETTFSTGELAGSFADQFGSQVETGPYDVGTHEVTPETNILRVGLIDANRFSRDCLIRAFAECHREFLLFPFASIQDCIRLADVDLIMYYSHDDGPFEAVALSQVTAIRQALEGVPVIVLSDARSAVQPRTIRNALKSGAQGFIPTRTTEMRVAFAAIRFVKAGGTFAPIELLIAGRSDQAATTSEMPPPCRLTSRQITVLTHLRQGKANKIIAYALGMSESTVKVHVRNIMRKMGATNRTQAVYKAQQFWSGAEISIDDDGMAEC